MGSLISHIFDEFGCNIPLLMSTNREYIGSDVVRGGGTGEAAPGRTLNPQDPKGGVGSAPKHVFLRLLFGFLFNF